VYWDGFTSGNDLSRRWGFAPESDDGGHSRNESREFIRGLRGSLYLTFEEGTCAARHDLLQPHVARVLACNPCRNATLKTGNKSDRIDACKLSTKANTTANSMGLGPYNFLADIRGLEFLAQHYASTLIVTFPNNAQLFNRRAGIAHNSQSTIRALTLKSQSEHHIA
jgi:hypothetical protein